MSERRALIFLICKRLLQQVMIHAEPNKEVTRDVKAIQRLKESSAVPDATTQDRLCEISDEVSVTNESVQTANEGIRRIDESVQYVQEHLGYGNECIPLNSREASMWLDELDVHYYNLFVTPDITSDHIVFDFTMNKKVALTEEALVDPDISFEFGRLTHDAIERIKEFPSLLVTKNPQYKQAYKNQEAYLGRVEDIHVLERDISIRYRKLWRFPQQMLNKHAKKLSMRVAHTRNELDVTHWAIKKFALLEQLEALQIYLGVDKHSQGTG